VCGVQPAALVVSSICAMQQAAWAEYMIFKDFYPTEQHSACQPEWRHAVWSVSSASKGICYICNVL